MFFAFYVSTFFRERHTGKSSNSHQRFWFPPFLVPSGFWFPPDFVSSRLFFVTSNYYRYPSSKKVPQIATLGAIMFFAFWYRGKSSNSHQKFWILKNFGSLRILAPLGFWFPPDFGSLRFWSPPDFDSLRILIPSGFCILQIIFRHIKLLSLPQ